MNPMRKLRLPILLALLTPFFTEAQLGGFNLTERTGFVFDANPQGDKTDAQRAVDEIKRLGGEHVLLNVTATMVTGRGNEIIPSTPPAERANERIRMVRLMNYIHSQNMTVGIRPILFVVGPQGEFPYYEFLRDAEGTDRAFLWWHGNIQPSDPNRWFASLATYLDLYINIARRGRADEFTIGAELYSMTVGIEDQWKEHPYGFPAQWLNLLRDVKRKLPSARIMYDINFTDASNLESGFQKSGGELERWRYRLVDLANPSDPEEFEVWQNLVLFWQELDAVGIDMYRSLASRNQEFPEDFEELVQLLKQRADVFASQLDTTWDEISWITQTEKQFIFKEIGYRSEELGFIDPFEYARDTGELNLMHQAAAFEAIFRAFWDVGWPWMGGIFFWDVPIDPRLSGPEDKGFSPIGKLLTEQTIQSRFL